MLDQTTDMVRKQLINRLRPDAPHRAYFTRAIDSAFDVLAKFESERARIMQDRRFTPEGQSEFLSNLVKETLAPALASDAGKTARHARERNESRLAGIGKPVFDKADVVAELGRQEVRSMIRSQSPERRFTTACECIRDKGMAEAIVSGVNGAALTGLTSEHFAQLRRMYLANFYGDDLKEIEAMRDDVSAVEAGVQMTWTKLFGASGMSEIQFKDYWQTLERTADQ